MSEKPKLRLIDLNELKDMSKMTGEALKVYLIEDLIPDLSSPKKTRELLSEVYKEGHDSIERDYHESYETHFINFLIKE